MGLGDFVGDICPLSCLIGKMLLFFTLSFVEFILIEPPATTLLKQSIKHLPVVVLCLSYFCLARLFLNKKFSEDNKQHPKTQHTRKRRKQTIPKVCVFGCVAFSGAKSRILGTASYLRFRVCCVFGGVLAPAKL